jgi:hypothetical protein
MPANYVLLEKITVGAAGAASVTFSSIPQTGYTDLVIKASVRGNYASHSDLITVALNGSTANSTRKSLYGTGTAAGSESSTDLRIEYNSGATATASAFGNGEMYIPNYTSANYKSTSSEGVSETNATTAFMAMTAGLWSNTAAVTSITMTPAGTLFNQYSTFYLYGVAKLGTTPAIVPYATGGDTIMTDGTYWYHTFISSGTFTPAKGLSCDYLVVAGGGGASGGGGGAGGMRSTVTATGGGGSLESKLSLASGTGYSVTIGAGGAGGVNTSASAAYGSNSAFATINAAGGGYGAGGGNGTAVNGGGGGAGGGAWAYNNTSTPTGGVGTANQGYAGGSVVNGVAGNAAGGAGGGAGGVGANSVGGGDGGNPTYQNGYKSLGVATSISGTSTTYSQGGRGYFIIPAVTPLDGPANSGNGGDAPSSGGGQTGKQGGSGIVIVRYAV